MSADCADPIALEELVAYHLGELEAAREAEVEEHYFGCDACAARLEAIVQLGAGVAEVVRRGAISASVTSDLVERGIEEGLQIRSYRVAPGERVACTAAPDDDFVAIRLGLDEAGAADSIDVDVEWTSLDVGTTEDRHIPEVTLDPDAKEIVLLFSGPEVRTYPRSRWRMEAVLRAPGSERRVGPYTLEHTPWEQLDDPV